MKSTTFLRSFGLYLSLYALMFGVPYVVDGTYPRPRSIVIGLVIVVLLSIARLRLDPNLKTNDPDIRPHYR